MKKILIKALFLANILVVNAQETKIYVDMGTRGHDVSTSMYGMFFEEINHAGDGGLYAEMLQNRGFEEQDYPSDTTYRDGRVYSPHAQNYYGGWYADFSIEWNVDWLKWKGWTVSNSGCHLRRTYWSLMCHCTRTPPMHCISLSVM